MKTFANIIAIWFLFQLVFVSASVNSNIGLDNECSSNAALRFIGGATFPITQFTFIEGGFCWGK